MDDPIGHLDFNPTCEWLSIEGKRLWPSQPCGLVAVRAIRWTCGCVTVVCGIHSIAVKPHTRFICDVHGGVHPPEKRLAL